MKKAVLAICTAIGLAMIGTSAMADKPDNDKTKGNGLPNISMKDAFKFEIHAYLNCPQSDDDNNGKRIVVQADWTVDRPGNTNKNNDIYISSGSDFDIIDSNGCTAVGDGYAEIQLPSNVATHWQVYVAQRGDPDNLFNLALCGEISGTVYCASGAVVTTRRFRDYSEELLSIEDPTGLLCDERKCELFQEVTNAYWDLVAHDHAKASVVFLPCSSGKTGQDPTLENCF